jgi:hypothetical protein
MPHPLDLRRTRPALLLGLCTAALAACGSTLPRRDPTGAVFPTVSARALDETAMRLPQDLHGDVAILLVGFEQDAQFDADRWLFGLLQAGTPARVLEVPTIASRIAGAFASSIDSGMRGGIPSEDWGSVVTLYGDGARRVKELTGTEGGSNMRVLLLDAGGVIRWFHDRGFSAGKLQELDQQARALAVDAKSPNG